MVKKLGNNLDNVLKGTADSDTLYGFGGDDTLYGYAGTDLFYAGAGDDKLYGGAGADLMQGGAGDDIYYVDNVLDDTAEFTDGGDDKVIAKVSFRLSANVENLVLTGTANLAGIGNSLSNTITGNSGDNRIVGGGDRDILTGGAGADKFKYNAGTDSGIHDTDSDFIKGFVHGVDKIDLSAIDANRTTDGNAKFRFIGSADFTDDVAIPPSSFAEVRFNYDASTKSTLVIVNIERAAPTIDGMTGHTLSGDTTADMQIILKGNIALTATDFIL